MTSSKVMIAVLALLLLGAVACEDDPCPACPEKTPAMSVVSVEVEQLSIYEPGTDSQPDPIYCDVTLRIENTSSKYSYSGISIPSAKVYLLPINRLLGEIRFQTDWDGVLDAGDVDTVVLSKIHEDAQIFPGPCNSQVRVEITVTSSKHGGMKRTVTTTFTCPF
jgi:hypothetical protein